MHGYSPSVRVFDSFEEEVNAIVNWTSNKSMQRRTGLVARTNSLHDGHEHYLRWKRVVEIYRISHSEAENRNVDGLRVATMHRVKGLEFVPVVFAGMNVESMPYKYIVNLSDGITVQ